MANRVFFVFIFSWLLLLPFYGSSQQIAVLQYNGGGDWYANPTALPNLVAFCNSHIQTDLDPHIAKVSPDSPSIFSYPLVYMTGHGNVVFSPADIKNLRTYLKAGGFLHIDDNYGMYPYIKREIERLFPKKNWQEIPGSHPIFQQEFAFKDGLFKVHEHDAKPPKAYGIFEKDRLVLLYTYQIDLGDGWEDALVHNNPETLREKALKMGANIISYVFSH